MSSLLAPLPTPRVLRVSTAPAAGALRPSVMGGAAALLLGIVLSILGTSDPLWWHLHFSRLGMFTDPSGFTFNIGVIASGALIAASSVPMALHLATAMDEGRCADPRAARALPPIMVALGASLSLIGVIPISVNEFLHDRAANAVLLSFLALVFASRRFLKEIPPAIGRLALVAIALLSVGIALMVTGVINLAAFEVIAFGSILTWVHLLERAVQTLGASTPRADAETTDAAPVSAPVAPAAPTRHPVACRVPRTARHHAPATPLAGRTLPGLEPPEVRGPAAGRMPRGQRRPRPTERTRPIAHIRRAEAALQLG